MEHPSSAILLSAILGGVALLHEIYAFLIMKYVSVLRGGLGKMVCYTLEILPPSLTFSGYFSTDFEGPSDISK